MLDNPKNPIANLKTQKATHRRRRTWHNLPTWLILPQDAAAISLRITVQRSKNPELPFIPHRDFASMPKTKKQVFEYVEPIGARVLVRKDEPKRETKGGIALPDQAEIPTITGRIVTISAQIEHDDDVPLRQYDKVLFHPKNAIPVDFDTDNQLFVVPVEDVVAVFRRDKPGKESE